VGGEPERFPGTALRVDDGTTPVIRCRVCATKGVWRKQAAEAAGMTGKTISRAQNGRIIRESAVNHAGTLNGRFRQATGMVPGRARQTRALSAGAGRGAPCLGPLSRDARPCQPLQESTTGTDMKPETRLAQWLMASVFVVMGGYRLWQALHGVPTSNTTLGFSVAELALGVAIATGWRLRGLALLAAVLTLVDATMSHRFWVLAGAEQGSQLLQFMKNIGLAGGLLLLASVAGGKRR
jgi:putative oxidoreductase